MFSKYQTIDGWTLLGERMPNSEEHPRVLIFTEGHNFAGQQFFDVSANFLNDAFFDEEADMPEECRFATHWMPLPFPGFTCMEDDEGPTVKCPTY